MKRIIIDCDPGIDDAQAIMMAYQHPGVTIEAITSVSGNVSLEYTTANILKILDVLDAKPIPVFAGARTALVEPGESADFVHGVDGLGDVGIPISDRVVEIEPAALALIRLGKENPGELELIAIGPLTNLALALRLDPELPTRYKRLVIMGGAHSGRGNTTNLPAEFNIYADPEAAAVVFDNWPGLTMISWEATLSHGMPIEDFEALFRIDNKRSQFLENVTHKMLKYLSSVLENNLSLAADPLAMAVMIEPEIVLESEARHVQVERYGRLSRGMTVVDWMNITTQSPNANIVLKINTDRFYDLLAMAFQ
jgi:purine nucleosidase